MCPTAAPVSASSLTLLSSGRFFSGLAAESAVGQSKEHPAVEAGISSGDVVTDLGGVKGAAAGDKF